MENYEQNGGNYAEQQKNPIGPLVGAIIIIIIILVGALYFWGGKLTSGNPEKNGAQAAKADDINSLENDLQNVDVNIGTDLDNI